MSILRGLYSYYTTFHLNYRFIYINEKRYKILKKMRDCIYIKTPPPIHFYRVLKKNSYPSKLFNFLILNFFSQNYISCCKILVYFLFTCKVTIDLLVDLTHKRQSHNSLHGSYTVHMSLKNNYLYIVKLTMSKVISYTDYMSLKNTLIYKFSN